MNLTQAERGAGIDQRRRNRETGTVIVVVDNRDGTAAEFGPDEGPWITVCEDHGTVCNHDTKRLAHSFAPVPTEWCEDCQAQYSTDGNDFS